MRTGVLVGSCAALLLGGLLGMQGQAVAAGTGVIASSDAAEAVLATGSEGRQLRSNGNKFQGTKFQGINLQGIKLQGINLQGINLQGINLQGTKWQGVKFQGTQLAGVENDAVRGEGYARGVVRVRLPAR